MKRTLSLAVVAGCLAAGLPACKSTDPPVPVGSIKKLGGAPARVLKVLFSPDGKSVLTLERRSVDPGAWSMDDQFAITKRPVSGGDAEDVYVSERQLVDFAALGDGVVALERRSFPSSFPTQPGETDERRELRMHLEDAQRRAIQETSLVKIDKPGAKPAQISPLAVRCFDVVGAAGGKWVAYSAVSTKTFDQKPEEAAVHVWGGETDEEYTLTRTGIVYDISPDGARVLIARRFPADVKRDSPDPPASPGFDLTGVSMVDVKGNTTVPLPGSLKVDGAEIATDKLAVWFAGDGLVFQSEKGDVYRTAMDGSKAVRVAGPLPEAAASSGAPSTGVVRKLDPRGAVLELRETGAGVEVGRPAVDKDHPASMSVRLEGTLAGLGPLALDATGTKIAFAVLSDTSRDGVLDATDDDAAVWVSDPERGSLGLERTKTEPLADELRPKIASALSIQPASVGFVHAGAKLEVTAELPWIDGEKAQALVDRWMAAGRALSGIVTRKGAVLKLRAGPFEARVVPRQEGGIKPYAAIVAMGVVFRDPEALPLVLRDPVLTTISGGSWPRTLTGTLENRGSAPLGPIEVVVKGKPFSSGDPNPRHVEKTIDAIEPGKRAPYKITVWEEQYGDFEVKYLVGGKPISPLNEYLRADGLDWVDLAIAIHAEHTAGVQNDFAPTEEMSVVRVKLTDKHVALPDAEREAMMDRIRKALAKHFRRYHSEYALRIRFLSPGGGGWALEEGSKPARFEREEDLDRRR